MIAAGVPQPSSVPPARPGAMAQSPTVEDQLAALERLVHRHNVLTLEEARAAGRILTGNPAFDFPPPAPPAPAAADETAPPPS